MEKTKSLLSRSRLLLSVLALALALGALAAAPLPAHAGGWSCEDGCWGWDAINGCVESVTCCANTDGRWFCVVW